MKILWTTFLLTFSALLPLINPLGSALVFLRLVGPAPPQIYRTLARRVAFNNVIFLVIVGIAGALVLRFFGISLPIVKVSGGLVIAFMGWASLNDESVKTNVRREDSEEDAEGSLRSVALENAFYPLTFPVTSGPGVVVALLTLAAHISGRTVAESLLGHLGIFTAEIALSITVYICYAASPRLTSIVSESTSTGILRVISFILLCIGIQIAWNGFAALLMEMFLNAPHGRDK